MDKPVTYQQAQAQQSQPSIPTPPSSTFTAAKRSGSLNVTEIFKMAWRSIRGNVTRSLLTALGVIIGVAAVITLTGIGGAVSAYINGQFADLGTNQLTISSGEGADGPPGGGLVAAGQQRTVSLEDAEAVRDLGDPRVANVLPTVQLQAQVKAGDTNQDYMVIGTWATYPAVRNALPEVGYFFTEADETARLRVAVLGFDVAQDLFGSSAAALGERVSISGIGFEVVGVLPDKGAGFNSANQNVLVPLSTFLQRLGNNDTIYSETAVDSITVQTSDTESMTELQADLERLLANRHNTLDPADYDFNITNQKDTLGTLNTILNMLQIFLGLIAGISLLVGGIGIMNIMLVSVTERTREIGIRKALGAKPRDILTQFLLESIVLSGAGGLIGLILGVTFSALASAAFGYLTIPVTGSIVAFSFAVAVGMFFGWYPARRAAALDPVDSLRYE
jgi:putative ABC transport system permease protein